jgi:hypothetical protein
MTNNNFRNNNLLEKLERHPLKAALARALDASELFAGDVEHIKLDRRLSAEGRDDARRSKLRGALRDNRDARAPLREMQAKLEAKRKAVAMPPFDPADILGFLRRQELRQTLRSLDAGQRAVLLAGNPAFADAMLETDPLVSGLLPAEAFIVETAKEQRLGSLFGSQLAEIDELEKTIADASMIFDLALVDLKASSEMDDRTFTEFSTPIMNRQGAPWLRRYTEDGKEVIRVIDLQNHSARIATEREVLDGKFYKDHAEYLADRAA